MVEDGGLNAGDRRFFDSERGRTALRGRRGQCSGQTGSEHAYERKPAWASDRGRGPVQRRAKRRYAASSQWVHRQWMHWAGDVSEGRRPALCMRHAKAADDLAIISARPGAAPRTGEISAGERVRRGASNRGLVPATGAACRRESAVGDRSGDPGLAAGGIEAMLPGPELFAAAAIPAVYPAPRPFRPAPARPPFAGPRPGGAAPALCFA